MNINQSESEKEAVAFKTEEILKHKQPLFRQRNKQEVGAVTIKWMM